MRRGSIGWVAVAVLAAVAVWACADVSRAVRYGTRVTNVHVVDVGTGKCIEFINYGNRMTMVYVAPTACQPRGSR